jgi:CRISPR-associated endonuclease/helicase Cas3
MPEYLAHTAEDGRTQTVAEHLKNTSVLAGRFAAAFGAKQLGKAAGLLHDIGKYSDAFQARIRDPAHAGTVDHSTAGAQAARDAGLFELAFAVAGHHAGLPDGGARQDSAEATTLAGRLKRPVPECSAWRQEVALLAAKIPPAFCADRFTDAFFTRMLYSCLVDADYLDTEAFMQGEQPRGEGESISALLEKVRARAKQWLSAPERTELCEKRNHILRTCMDTGAACKRGLYTLTVPTGGGKTFASLAFALEHAAAQGMSRVIYVIPYTSIIDQTVDVFSGILGPENVLAHHAGAEYQLSEKAALSPENYRKALAAENWDAPVIVTTAVQFFESLYASRSSRCRKLHNLANSVVIFDEAQTLPLPYLRPCVAAIAQLVQHYGATAVLCTATQPALGDLFGEFAKDLPLREICPGTEELYQTFRRVTLADAGVLTEEQLAVRLRAYSQVLCVVNCRKQAQALYAEMPPEGRFCLTTLLCAADRRQKLAEIRARLKEGQPCRVISTSLIEAGVDVDFPAAFRERAGLDSILQTAGRCNREDHHPAAESTVFVFSLSGVRAPAMLAQQLAALQAAQRAGKPLDSPETIMQYFQLLHLLKGDQALDQKGILPALNGTLNGSMLPFSQVAERFSLIDTPTRSIYIPVGAGADLCARLQNGERSRSLFRALGIYAVAVYPQHFDALHRAGAIAQPDSETAILTDLHQYSPDTGLAMDVESGQGWFI